MNSAPLIPLLLVLLSLPCLLSAQTASDELGWELRRNEQDIQVFSRKQAGNPIDEFKGMTIVQGNIDSAYAVLRQVNRFLGSDPTVARLEVLKWEDSTRLYVWQEVKMPALLKNRDAVSKVTFSPTTHGYFAVAESAPEYIPLRKGLERVGNFRLMVGLRRLDRESFEILYKITIWPSGESPAAIRYVNKIFVTSTFKRLQQLRDLVSQPAITGK